MRLLFMFKKPFIPKMNKNTYMGMLDGLWQRERCAGNALALVWMNMTDAISYHLKMYLLNK